ncbi:hypothetical protein DOTSEDRAFT_70713 [Dothistroma septosporum NZE10]|uniref:PRISE-like Rossmann-fold domain-containing protein n=1 Tax=Dothistroma septosporum (strain NZE10 / CBS 128990) TaxID=675120 RepID=N1PTX9_DOTSN|nr:hypothetical protein DOTSEDRAFT_70713 [Dothistroma septosporum NZE10]
MLSARSRHTVLSLLQNSKCPEDCKMPRVALITGANGITGTALIEHLVRNTTSAEWSRIVITSRSPVKLLVEDPRLNFIALDFTDHHEAVAQSMAESCKDVTHAYFSSYIHKDDFAELTIANKALFENFLQALTLVAPKLENCTLQTGGKYYGLHLGPVPTPCREDEPRRGDPEENFYFPQEDRLAEKQEGQQWTWNVIRPEAIIGHTSKPNGMNSALTCALYFMICRELGEEARMPTNQVYWNGTETNSDAPLLAKFTIWASTTPNCANQAFNFVNGDHFTWRYMWPRLAEYLGAQTSSDQNFDKSMPPQGEVQQEFSLAAWAEDKKYVWARICDEAGVPEAKSTFDAGTWAFQDWVFMRTWYPNLSMNKAKKFGWTGFIDSYDSMTTAFEKFREVRQIP